MRDMEWYVYVDDFNSKSIEIYNIFNHQGFNDDIKSIYKKYKNDYNTFCQEVQKSLQYYFWSRCEWEIILSDWPPSNSFHEEKIDVYDQVMLNKEIFFNYVWEMTHKRKQRKKN